MLPLQKIRFPRLILFSFVALAGVSVRADERPAQPIKALMIAGGGFHDYSMQKDIIANGISARAHVQWTIFYENGDTAHQLGIYSKPDFGKGYDVIVHNECYADVTDPAFVAKVLAPHRNGIPGVVIHCTLHTFRAMKTDEWREFIGMSSNHHGPQQPLQVEVLQPTNPIMAGFPAHWVTNPEELYSIDQIWPNAQPLAQAFANDEKKNDPVIWTNLYLGKTRVFGTSMAHNDATMQDPVYLSLITRGLLWACDKLDANGKPKPGYGPEKTTK